MKKQRIIFWTTTGILFLFEGLLTGLTAHTEMAIASVTSLGYPEYFAYMLNTFKVIGAFTLIIPKVSGRVKEWAYAGFGIDFTAAIISKLIVDGIDISLSFPVIAGVILLYSYRSYHNIDTLKNRKF